MDAQWVLFSWFSLCFRPCYYSNKDPPLQGFALACNVESVVSFILPPVKTHGVDSHDSMISAQFCFLLLAAQDLTVRRWKLLAVCTYVWSGEEQLCTIPLNPLTSCERMKRVGGKAAELYLEAEQGALPKASKLSHEGDFEMEAWTQVKGA